jgi:HAMP domain-containing protein
LVSTRRKEKIIIPKAQWTQEMQGEVERLAERFKELVQPWDPGAARRER